MGWTRCVLALVILSAVVVQSWDFAAAVGNQLDFYTGSDKISIENDLFRHATALAYDDSRNRLLFIKKEADNASIYSFEMSTHEHQVLVTGKDIGGFAIDKVRELLYWTDIAERSIYWISLKQVYKGNDTKNLFIKMDDDIPRAIAVDICNGYVYWTNTNSMKPTIERVRLNGNEREVVIDDDIYYPVSLAIDPQMKKMFWADNRDNNKYNIFSTDLDGKNRLSIIVGDSGTHFIPNALTVSKDLMYIIDVGSLAIWQHSKFQITNSLESVDRLTAVPSGIVANYTIEEQTKGIEECSAIMTSLQNTKIVSVHGEDANDLSSSKCALVNISEKCDVSVCQNYCFQGTCTVSDEGEPSCRCESGYSGARCEINMCFNYCLNSGACNLTEENKPVCHCIGDYSGSRCEAITNVTNSPTYKSGEKNITLAKLLDNNPTLAKPVDNELTLLKLNGKNVTLANMLFNRHKIAGKVTVNFEIDSN